MVHLQLDSLVRLKMYAWVWRVVRKINEWNLILFSRLQLGGRGKPCLWWYTFPSVCSSHPKNSASHGLLWCSFRVCTILFSDGFSRFHWTWFLCLADLFLPRKALFPQLSRSLISKSKRWHLAAATVTSSLWALPELAGQAPWWSRAGLVTGISMADYSSHHRLSVALKFTKSMLFPSLEQMNKMHVINIQRAKQVNVQIIAGLIKALYFL